MTSLLKCAGLLRVMNCHCSIGAREWRGGAGGLWIQMGVKGSGMLSLIPPPKSQGQGM